MTLPVGFPLSNAGLKYINGLGISTGATNLLVNMAAGAARDSTNQDDIVLPSAVVINSAANGANGLDTGTLAASTFYYVYVIGSSLSANPETNVETQVSTIGGTTLNGIVLTETVVATPASTVANNPQPAGLLSLSATAPTLPTGYDMFRRVGAVLTDGASHILAFWQSISDSQSARTMYYDVGVQVLNAGASAAYAAVDLHTAVPAIAASNNLTNVIFDVIVTPTGAGNHANFRPTGSASVNGVAIMSGDAAGVAHEDSIVVPAAIAANVLSIDYKVVGTVTLNVAGYIDQL